MQGHAAIDTQHFLKDPSLTFMMMKQTIVLLVLLRCAFLVSAQITSTFDSDADGWTFLSSSTSISVAHNPANGDPGGFASVTYSSNVNITVQNWIAPSKFLGNHLVRSLGMQLKFNLQQSIAGTGAGYDVLIRNGGNFIYLSGITPKPAVAPAWTSYSFTLDETGGWYYSAGAVVATRAQIKAILANVTSLEIRGAYGTNAAYTSGLDNVILEQRTLTAAPVASSLSPTSGMPGDVITIHGSGFDPDESASFVGRFTIPTIPVEGWFVGDFDGDGWEDFAVTNNNTEDVIDIYRNLGLGGTLSAASFDAKVTIPAPSLGGSGTNGAGLWFADLDGDGKTDAITSNALSAFSAAFVTLRKTSTPGSISFELPEYWTGGSDETPIALVADLDGDGRPEIMGGEGASCGCAYRFLV